MDKNNKPKKAWYKRVWVWIGIVVILAIIGSINAPKTQTNSTATTSAPIEAPAPAKWDVNAAYAKVSNGMTKLQVESATGKTPDNCTVTEDPTFGKNEMCIYGNVFVDKASITVTFRQDVVEMKTKSTY